MYIIYVYCIHLVHDNYYKYQTFTYLEEVRLCELPNYIKARQIHLSTHNYK